MTSIRSVSVRSSFSRFKQCFLHLQLFHLLLLKSKMSAGGSSQVPPKFKNLKNNWKKQNAEASCPKLLLKIIFLLKTSSPTKLKPIDFLPMIA
jgi:hypothetical protein